MKSIITTLAFIFVFSVTFANACEDCGCSGIIVAEATKTEDTAIATDVASKVEVSIEELDPATIAYVRTVGGYGNVEIISEAYGKVMDWATANNLMVEGTQVIGIGWDDPEQTPLEECRYDACVTVPAGTSGDGDIGITDIPGGTYAVYTFTGKYETIGEDIGLAWGAVMGWMATSGYEFDMRPPLEIYTETKEQFEAGEYVVDLCVPVTRK